MYRVLLHNDNMNRREYVVQALMKVVDGMTLEDAISVMQEAHINDIALVTVTSQERAEEYVTGLRRNGLTSTLEPSGSGGGGGGGCGADS
jgi:ATP-dependent Clp protease adaptor protein ClpS